MGNYEEEKVRGGMDRRSFFKLGGLTAGMAAFAGMAGCAPQQEMADTGGDNETVAARVPYSVFETDTQNPAPASVRATRWMRRARPART